MTTAVAKLKVEVQPVTELADSSPITLEMLKGQDACLEGLRWVKKNLPEGAEYGAFVRSLEASGHTEWAEWLIGKFGASVLAAKWRIKGILDATDAKQIKPSSPDLNDNGRHSARIGSSGHKCITAAVGYESVGKVGPDGCLALAWWDDKAERPRLAVGYIGEELKANTWYGIRNGKFVEVQTDAEVIAE